MIWYDRSQVSFSFFFVTKPNRKNLSLLLLLLFRVSFNRFDNKKKDQIKIAENIDHCIYRFYYDHHHHQLLRIFLFLFGKSLSVVLFFGVAKKVYVIIIVHSHSCIIKFWNLKLIHSMNEMSNETEIWFLFEVVAVKINHHHHHYSLLTGLIIAFFYFLNLSIKILMMIMDSMMCISIRQSILTVFFHFIFVLFLNDPLSKVFFFSLSLYLSLFLFCFFFHSSYCHKCIFV